MLGGSPSSSSAERVDPQNTRGAQWPVGLDATAPGPGVERRPVARRSSDRADADGTRAFTTSFIIFQEFELFTEKGGILSL